jgi:hypothetical protein
VAYRERQKLPALQQKLLRLFGCSSTAVLCAAAEAAAFAAEKLGLGTLGQKRSPDYFMFRQLRACNLFAKSCAAILGPDDDSSTQSAPKAADGNAQQQQLAT